MKVELLEPWDTEHNDFLARFVARTGAGPHHLTFKVDDLDARARRARARRGFTPVGIERSRPALAGGVPPPARGARHRRAARAGERGRRPGRVARVRRGQRTVGRADLVGRSRTADRPDTRTCAGSCSARPTPRRCCRSSPACSAATRSRDATRDGTELAWPGGGRVRIERRADRAAGRRPARGRRAGGADQRDRHLVHARSTGSRHDRTVMTERLRYRRRLQTVARRSASAPSTAANTRA